MDNISKLIQEAKPLYFERKKQRVQTAMIFTMFLLTIPALEINHFIQRDSLLSQSESIIEYQGLPTDDYGLLMVY